MTDLSSDTNAVELATELTIAWLSNPNTRASADEVPSFLGKMHEAVSGLSAPTEADQPAEPQAEYTPKVSTRKSLASKDHIVSMIDGKPYKTLRRHLAGHGLTPEQYRERYNLRSDYPMVAENYSQARRDMAKKIGLGRKAGESRAAKQAGGDDAKPKGARGGRRKADTAAAE